MHAAGHGAGHVRGPAYALQDLVGLGKKGVARGGELHLLAVAQQQLDAQLFLQGLDGQAQWWLRDGQPVGGAAEMELLGQDDEVAQKMQLHAC